MTVESSRRSRVPPAGARRSWSRSRRLGERRTSAARGTAASTAAATCSSDCRAAATPSRRRRPCSRIRSGSRGARCELPAGGALVVYPRLVALAALFSEAGAHAQDGRRLLLRRPSGFDLHSVREYEEGESLRKVHWALDGAARPADGEGARGRAAGRDRRPARRRTRGRRAAGESFDVQVRAAGSILHAHARPGPPRRAGRERRAARKRPASRRSRATGWPRSRRSPPRSRTATARSSSCSPARAAPLRARSSSPS